MKKNIILKTVDEILSFTDRIIVEIAQNEKHTFLVLSNPPIFEIKKLESYLFENSLNVLAKTKILNACNNFIRLENNYQKIKDSNNSNDYYLENIKNEYMSKDNLFHKVLYFFCYGDSLEEMTEEEWKNINMCYCEEITQSKIAIHCKYILSLISPEAPQKSNTKNTDEIKQKKIPEKWYALLYWIELSANGELPPINNEGGFIKSEIEKIGIEKTGTTGQSFYRSFIELDLNNEIRLNIIFGTDWKQEIIEMSNNNQTIINYIELKYK